MNRDIAVVLTSLVTILAIGLVSAEVNGASTVTPGTSERGVSDNPSNNSAIAGNVTELTIVGDSLTQAWQGYFGNVSGAIELTDASNNTIYNWSLASPQGEIYASNSSSVSWSSIACFNWTLNGAGLESNYNITSTDADGVNETFSDSNLHAAFSTGTTSFIANQCMSSYIFDSTEAGVAGNFEEVLLIDSSNNTVFASLLEEDTLGFDGASHDFEMLVLEDGHNGDSSTTTYFFYVELE